MSWFYKNKKNILSAVILIFSCFLIFGAFDYGQANPAVPVPEDPYGLKATQEEAKNWIPEKVAGSDKPEVVIASIVAYALSFLGVAFFLLVLYAGIYWMTARGDKTRVDKAKDMLERAIIGVLIVLGSYALSYTVFKAINSQIV